MEFGVSGPQTIVGGLILVEDAGRNGELEGPVGEEVENGTREAAKKEARNHDIGVEDDRHFRARTS